MPSPLSPLLRYGSVVPHFDAFLESCEQPLPATVRVNALRATAAEVRESLEARGVAADPFPWYPDGLRLDHPQPGVLFEQYAGLVHTQEEASMVPPVALAPRPGELVLDLCASPGSKATQLAALMAGSGHVVANEMMLSRLPALRSTCERLGALSVGFTCCDGRWFPLPPGGFDRVLVDPPCSSEGMVRRSPRVLRRYDARFRRILASVQAGLLERACRLVRPGGLVAYSTCTFAPEEDESQVARALRLGMELVPGAAPEGLAHAPGLRSWGGEEYPEGMERCIRLYPHLGDTGGFFVAVLRKPEGPDAPEQTAPGDAARGQAAPQGGSAAALAPPPSPAPPGRPALERLEGAERERVLAWWDERFGVPPSAFDGLDLYGTASGAVRVARGPLAAGLWYDSVGLALVRPSDIGEGGWRPAHDAALALGRLATRGRVELDREQARRFVAGEPVELDGEPLPSRRFLLAFHDGAPLGCGLAGGRTLVPQVPKERRIRAIALP